MGDDAKKYGRTESKVPRRVGGVVEGELSDESAVSESQGQIF